MWTGNAGFGYDLQCHRCRETSYRRLDDDEVDSINRQMYLKIQEAIQKHPDKIVSLIYLLSVSRDLERIADHATNIAEDVIYMIDGKIVRHKSEQYRPETN